MSLPQVCIKKTEMKSISISHDYQLRVPICANQSGFRPKEVESRIMMQRRPQKSGFLCLPRRRMTKEFISVAGTLILWTGIVARAYVIRVAFRSFGES